MIMNCTPLLHFSAAQILEKHQERFISDMDAEEMAGTLKQKGVIPPEVAADIANARSPMKANEVLYDNLQSQASEDDLKRLFQLCSERQGYSKMSTFGKHMLGELGKEVSLHWPSPFGGNCSPIRLPMAATLVGAAGGPPGSV